MPKKSEVASFVGNCSPVKRRTAIFVRRVRHVRGEMGEVLNNRAVESTNTVSLFQGGRDAECGQRTVLEHRGAIQLDHDLVGILVLLDVTHGADRRIARQMVVCRRGTGAVERY